MAEDFSLDIALGLTPASLKAIQNDINNAIRQINPELNIGLGALERFQKEGIKNIVASIGAVDADSVRQIRESIEKALQIRLDRIRPTARAKRELQKDLKEALADLEIAVKGAPPNIGGFAEAGQFQSAADVTAGGGAEKIAKAQERLSNVLNEIADVSQKERREQETATERSNKARRLLLVRAERNAERNRRLEQESAQLLENFNNAERKALDNAKKTRAQIEAERIREAKSIAEETAARGFKNRELRRQRRDSQESLNVKAEKLLAGLSESEKKARENEIAIREKIAADRIKEAEAIKKETIAIQQEEEARRRRVRKLRNRINNDADELLAKFNQVEAQLRQKELDAKNKVIEERLKEAEAIKKETAQLEEEAKAKKAKEEEEARKLNIDAERLLAKFTSEEIKARKRAVQEALDINREINDTNRLIRQRSQSLVGVIQAQIDAGNLGLKNDPNSANAKLVSAVRGAAQKVADVAQKAPLLSRAFSDGGALLVREVKQIQLGGLRSKAADLQKAFVKATNEVAKAKFERDRAQSQNASPERQRKLSNEYLDALVRQRAIQGQINQTKREINSLEGEISKALRERLANERAAARVAAQEASRSAQRGRGGPSRKGNDVTFRGIGDIQDFGAKLDTRSVERFADVLQKSTIGTRSAIELQKNFATAIQKSNGPISKIRDNLNSGTRAAFEFGERSFDAAQRLLAWAAPATFIFSTIAALKDATRQLTDLDTQARRLVFFENADFGGQLFKGATNVDFSSISKATQEAKQNVDLFIRSSKDLGIALDDVVEATVTASRVGQRLTDTITKLDGSTEKVRSSFLNTVIELVRLEGGALKAEDAVNSLNAISIQFFDRLKKSISDVDIEGFSETLDTGLAAAGSLLAVVAAKSAFSVRELADATARVGAAFANIQGTGLPQVISLIGEASSATGANVGRLSTALRQILTFSVQNAEKLKESFDIEIIDAEGGVAGFEKVLEVLRKINELQGTEKAVELAKLIGDRRNVADIQSLSVAVGKLEAQFGALSDEQVEVAIVQNAVEQQFKQNVLAADSMAAVTNKLRAEVVALANNANLGDFVKSITRGLTEAARLTSVFIDGLAKVGPLLEGIATFALASLAPKIGAGIAGLLGSSLSSATRLAVKEQTATAIQREESLIKAVNAAEREGLLTTEQARAARVKQLGLIQQQFSVENQILKTQTLLSAERKKANVDLERTKNLEAQIEQLLQRQELISKRQAALRSTAQGQVLNTSTFTQLSKGNKLAGIGAVATLAATLFGEKFAFAITKDEKMARGIGDALTAAVSGGAVGSALGSLVPGIGNIIGGVLGGIAGLATSVFSSVVGQAEAKLEEEAQTLEARRKGLLAGIAQREIIQARKLQEVEAKDERTRVQQEINQLQQKSAEIYERLSSASQEDTSIQFLKNEALRIEEQIRQKNLQLREEELKNEKDKLAITERAAQLRRDEQAILNKISNAEKALNSLIGERAKAELGLVLNKTKVEAEIENINKRIRLLVQKREVAIRLGANESELSQIAQEIADLQQEGNNKRSAILGEEIAAQERILDISTNAAKEQIDAWEQASRSVVSAFEAVTRLQNEAANNFFERGKSISDTLSSSFSELSGLLENAGASIAERLAAARDVQDRRLAAVQSGGAQAINRIRRGPVRPFGSTQELRGEAERVASIVAEAGVRSNQKIFDEESKIINDRLALLRTEADNSRQLFELRLNQTRQEIDVRKRIAEEEIAILRQRQEIERQLNSERIKQQQEFGRLIIEGPEQFLAVAKDIKNARSFFKGISDLSTESLQRIDSRASRARETGQFSGLQSVLRGLEALQKFGGRDLVGGVSNSQLQSVFERIQVALPEEVSKDLKRQQQELNNQTYLQQQIEIRQRQQEALLQAEAALTEAQLKIETSAQDAAIKQRDAMIGLMEASIRQQNKDSNKLFELQRAAFRALLHVNADGNVEMNQLLVEFQKKFTEGQDSAFFNAENERLSVSNALVENANTSLADTIRNATSSVGVFSSKLLEINGIQEKFSSTLSGTGQGVVAASTNTSLSGIGGAEAISRIEELVRRTSTGGMAIGRSREFLELEEATRGGRGSREQRSRLAELRREELRPRSFGAGQEGSVARTLLQDQTVRAGLEDGFRGLLQRGVGGDSSLVKELKEARGIGQAGARNIDPDRIREILGRSGLSGLARDVDTRGEATQLVDKLLRFSEELNRTPDKLSERAVGILKEILATELKEGFKEINQVLQARRHPLSDEEKLAAGAASTGLNIFNSDDAVEFANRFNEAFKEQFDERAKTFVNFAAAGFEGAIRAAIQNNTIKVDLPALDIELKSTVTNVLAGDSFLNNLEDILTRNGLSAELAKELREKIKKIATVMVNNGQLPPELE